VGIPVLQGGEDVNAVIYRQSARALARCFAECLAHLAGPTATIRRPASRRSVRCWKEPSRSRATSLAVTTCRSGRRACRPVQITDTANFRNPHYHRSGDTPETLDYHRLADVVAATALAVERVAERIDG